MLDAEKEKKKKGGVGTTKSELKLGSFSPLHHPCVASRVGPCLDWS